MISETTWVDAKETYLKLTGRALFPFNTIRPNILCLLIENGRFSSAQFVAINPHFFSAEIVKMNV
jgi:hypothetical protein